MGGGVVEIRRGRGGGEKQQHCREDLDAKQKMLTVVINKSNSCSCWKALIVGRECAPHLCTTKERKRVNCVHQNLFASRHSPPSLLSSLLSSLSPLSSSLRLPLSPPSATRFLLSSLTYDSRERRSDVSSEAVAQQYRTCGTRTQDPAKE